ncbi:MAG: hypothetical protein OXR82_20140 [Gammaproteobacteria bacterium]|nr:hypothetical protein [Gammaproteobacteria bacterium]MDE0260683.1 hypothetical protein [Gammaproteobacteria bacterium]
MTTHTRMLHVRVDTKIKRKAPTFKRLTAATAVRLFLHRIAIDQPFSLGLEVLSAQTPRAMAES